MPIDSKTVANWKAHWQDEADAAFLYRVLAECEPSSERRSIYTRLADVEDRHTHIWKDLLAQNSVTMPASAQPSTRARLMAWLARKFGPGVLLNALLREEGREVKGYLALNRNSTHAKAKETALVLAQESAHHAETLGSLTNSGGEPWHKAESGGFLRNVVYGFNDGLTANFGLVAGVIGAFGGNETAPAHLSHILLVSGIAGIIADSLSMGSSGYLAAKSQEEVYAHEIEMEKQEIELMPEVEEQELALIYEAKGIAPEQARKMAKDVMASPEKALREKVREELKIGESYASPLKEGLITGTATAVGALLPVAPFFFWEGNVAIWTSFSVSMLSHFAVGAARSVFTGRGIFRSGFDMFIVGMGIAIAGYFAGEAANRWFGGAQ
jgi:VIT1/CCC1 family predicted Fe2+/Mn2+ transporter